jgi:hypothetical protein
MSFNDVGAAGSLFRCRTEAVRNVKPFLDIMIKLHPKQEVWLPLSEIMVTNDLCTVNKKWYQFDKMYGFNQFVSHKRLRHDDLLTIHMWYFSAVMSINV